MRAFVLESMVATVVAPQAPSPVPLVAPPPERDRGE
jgi:hypothetical protein